MERIFLNIIFYVVKRFLKASAKVFNFLNVRLIKKPLGQHLEQLSFLERILAYNSLRLGRHTKMFKDKVV